MTTPQSGREAFEALVEKWRRQTEGNCTDRANCMSRCADELEAALAQQELEVGEAVGWVSRSAATAHMRVNLPEGTPLYTAAPKQQAATLSDIRGAVARGWCSDTNAHKVMDVDLAEAIALEVAALLAALPGKTEVDRG